VGGYIPSCLLDTLDATAYVGVRVFEVFVCLCCSLLYFGDKLSRLTFYAINTKGK